MVELQPQYCDRDCHAICDFCSFYDFNGDEEGCYTGNGYCNRLEEKSDPDNGCAGFRCRKLDKVNNG